MMVAAIVIAIVAGEFLLGFLIGSFMRVGTNADTRLSDDLHDEAR